MQSKPTLFPRFLAALFVVAIGGLLLLPSQMLRAQTILADSGTATASTYVFNSLGGAVTPNTMTEGGANANTGSTLDLDSATSVVFTLGTFKNNAGTASGSTAIRIGYTLNADKNDAGAIVAIFDTNASSSINSGDKGFAFNIGWDSSGVATTLTTAFTIAVTGGTATAYAPSTITFSSTPWSTASYTYQQTLASPGSSGSPTTGISSAFAVLVADIDSTLVGKTPLVTVFGTTALSTAAGATTFAGSILDYYGNSANTSVFSTANGNAGTVLIPEPSTWAMSGALFGTGLIAWWRRRRAVSGEALIAGS